MDRSIEEIGSKVEDRGRRLKWRRLAKYALAVALGYSGTNALLDAGGALEAHHAAAVTAQVGGGSENLFVSDENQALANMGLCIALAALSGLGLLISRGYETDKERGA